MDANQLIAFGDIETASERPGLYAWYGQLYAPIADYRRDVDAESGSDRGERRFRALLAKHTLRYQALPLAISARGNFGIGWRGLLRDTNRDELQALLLGDVDPDSLSDEDKGANTNLAWAVRDEKRRAVLAAILSQATPLLAAPIYIGVTKNIRARLRKHVSLYRSLVDAIGTDQEKLAALQLRVEQEGLEFAHRAVAMDFRPDHLYVATYEIDLARSGDHTTDELRNIVGVAEWLLNRWHRPFAGKR